MAEKKFKKLFLKKDYRLSYSALNIKHRPSLSLTPIGTNRVLQRPTLDSHISLVLSAFGEKLLKNVEKGKNFPHLMSCRSSREKRGLTFEECKLWLLFATLRAFAENRSFIPCRPEKIPIVSFGMRF